MLTAPRPPRPIRCGPVRRALLWPVVATIVVAGGGPVGAAPPAAPVATPPPAASGWGDRPVGRVHAQAAAPIAPADTGPRPAPPTAGRTRCIGVDRVAGAVVFGDRAVELTMTGGAKWRMTFAQECPALSFYQGFYYRRATAGRLCAGKDAVIARSGGECPIASILPVRKPKRR